MKKYAYYHVYLTNETGCWYHVFLDQIFQVINSGLYEELEKLYVICIGNQQELDLFTGLASTFNKIEILRKINVDQNKKENLSLQYTSSIDYNNQNRELFDEVETLSILQQHANREDAYFLYFHTKGITAPWRMREERIYKEFVNYYLWRKFLEWGNIEKWKDCVTALETYSAVGVNFSSWPVAHYSGTFWWSKSSYIRKLPNIIENDWWTNMRMTTDLKNWDSNRNKPEMWLGAAYNNDFYSLKDHPEPPPITCLVHRYYPRSEYTNDISA